MTDFRARVATHCAPLPGARASEPFGGEHEAWKVGDKIFACFTADQPGVSVKTPDVETATMLIDAGVARRARYFHKSWVNLPEGVEDGELAYRITASYDIVRASLTKKLQAELGPRDGA